jgi:transposase-like protein
MERRRFAREFKLEAVRLIRDRGVSYAQASQDLNVHPTQPRNWVKAFADDPQHAFPGPGHSADGRDGAQLASQQSVFVGQAGSQSAAGAGGVRSFRHDALATERTSLFEDHRAVDFEMAVNAIPGRARRNSPLRVALRTSIGSRRKSSPSSSSRSNAQRVTASSCCRQRIISKTDSPFFFAGDCLAVHYAGSRQGRNGSNDQRGAVGRPAHEPISHIEMQVAATA